MSSQAARASSVLGAFLTAVWYVLLFLTFFQPKIWRDLWSDMPVIRIFDKALGVIYLVGALAIPIFVSRHRNDSPTPRIAFCFSVALPGFLVLTYALLRLRILD